jgi:hypothetical protein
MEIGGFFILVLLVIVVAVIGLAIVAVAARGRHRQLSPRGGSLDAGLGPEDEEERSPRPEHVRVENEQRTRFMGTR